MGEDTVKLSKKDLKQIKMDLYDVMMTVNKVREMLGMAKSGKDLKRARESDDDDSSHEISEEEILAIANGRNLKKKQKKTSPSTPSKKERERDDDSGDNTPRKRKIKPMPDGINRGVWNAEELALLKEALAKYEDDPDKITKLANHVKTRTKEQVRKHLIYNKEKTKNGGKKKPSGMSATSTGSGSSGAADAKEGDEDVEVEDSSDAEVTPGDARSPVHEDEEESESSESESEEEKPLAKPPVKLQVKIKK